MFVTRPLKLPASDIRNPPPVASSVPDRLLLDMRVHLPALCVAELREGQVNLFLCQIQPAT